MPVFGPGSVRQRGTLHPDLQTLLDVAIKKIDFVIIEGFRNEAAQNDAFKRGASKLKWPHGKHNRYPSIAVDIAPVYYAKGAAINWEDVPAFARLMGYIERIADELELDVRLGLDWDMDFRTAGHDPGETFRDAPHLELVL